MAVRRHIEDDLQIACVTWFSCQYRGLELMLHHSPNGGFRDGREAAKFKRMGTRAGFPDLILTIPRKGYSCLCLELKSSGGTQTDKQKTWQKKAEEHGAKYEIVRDVEQFEKIVKDYLS